MRKNIFYLNRIIKIISPLTFQTFKVELNGDENELRELLATILEINPNAIKGLRDSYNNYYTLSSAVNNPHINTNPYNYYTVVIKDLSSNIGHNNKKPLIIETPPYNCKLLKDDHIHTLQNENNINYHTNFLNNTYNFYEDNNFSQRNINNNDINYYNNNINENHDINEYLNFADDLYKKKYIDYDLNKKLKKLIMDDNNEVLTIISPYINIKSQKSYDEFAQKIIPIISARTAHIKYDSSSSSDNEKNIKVSKILKQEEILENIKANLSKSEYSKLKKMLKDKKKNKKILEIIKNFNKNKDFSKCLSKLLKLISSEEEEEKSNSIKNDESEKSKSKNDISEKDLKKIIKTIINALKKKASIDVYYIAKYDFQKMSKDEKISLLTKKFKLHLDSIINDDNYKIPYKNMTLINNYYMKYIEKKIKKNYDQNQNLLYESLLEQEENNVLLKLFKDLLKHKNINELRKQIKQIIKETEETIQGEGEGEGEGEEEEEDDEEEEENNNEGKTSIKEEENEEEEEEEDDEEGEEEEDEKDSKNDDNKSSSKSSDNIILLKDDNKDRAVNMLNNNYRKINNYNYKNDNNSNNDNNNKDKKDEQNLGLGFVVIKQKKSTKDELPHDNKILKLNTTDSNKNDQNESSLSTNNPNKKLNQFIQQIEHMKKIDEIKKPIIEAINDNNKYIMDLFQKFQKNKLSLNPKSLLACYKKIKENPETNSKGNLFKSLVKDVPNISESVKEFLCYEFNNKNSELETYFNLYENEREKDDFIESIELFLKKPASKQLLDKYNSSQIKRDIEPILSQKNKNDNLESKSLEIVKIMEKYNLFKDNQLNQIKDSIKNGDNVFASIFENYFNDKDYDEFFENINIALKNQANKGGNKK